jgi:hypothetical protein
MPWSIRLGIKNRLNLRRRLGYPQTTPQRTADLEKDILISRGDKAFETKRESSTYTTLSES